MRAATAFDREAVALWPARSRPKDGELLSSWMTRLASSHGLSYAALCKRTWPRRTFWRTDVDLVADGALLSKISAHTGVGVARLDATTVAGLGGWLFPDPKRSGVRAWVLPAGLAWVKTSVRDPRPRRRYVRQYCPACLAADPEPYFRLAWRLAFVTLCEQHGVELVERCPRCEGPVAPTLSDRLLVADARSEHQAFCYRCGTDLRKAIAPGPADRRDLAIQRRLAKALRERWAEIAAGRPVMAPLYFSALRQLIDLVSRGGRGADVRAVIGWRCGLEGFTPSGERESVFEHLPAGDRRSVLRMVMWLLEGWPARFVDLAKTLRRYPVTFGDFPGAAFWIWETLREVAVQPYYSASREEVSAALAHLQARRRTWSRQELYELVGARTPAPQRQVDETVRILLAEDRG